MVRLTEFFPKSKKGSANVKEKIRAERALQTIWQLFIGPRASVIEYCALVLTPMY